MKNIKKILIVSLIFSLLIINLCTVSYAEFVTITKENLTEAFEKLAKNQEESESDENYNFTVLEDKIELTSEGKKYILNYDLTNKPTFTIEIPIKQGMTYNEYNEEINGLSFPLLAYIAVANIQGVELEDAATYGLLYLLAQGLSNFQSNKSVVESNGVIILGNGEKTFKVSEFGEHVIEYTNYLYEDTTYLDNAGEGIDSFVWTMQKEDVTATSCNLVSTITINTDADFSKLNGFMDSFSDSLDNSMNNWIGSFGNSNTDKNTNTTNITKLPQTGEELTVKDILYGVIAFAVVGVIALSIYTKKMNQIK